jgi:integrase
MKQFVEWCEDRDIDNLNDLSGRSVYQYDSDRRAEDLSISTLKSQLGTLQRFLRFCETIEAVEEGLSEKVDVPTPSKREEASEVILEPPRALEILEKLGRYQYASRDHVMFAVMWYTGARIGAIRALDVGDCFLTESDLSRLDVSDDVDVTITFVYFRHRPDTETPLKNQDQGERPVTLPDEIGELVKEYIRVRREDITDQYGREPLFPAPKKRGRATKGALRQRIYILTQPCRHGPCPHGRDPSECEALEHGYEARCPSARSPHPVRSGSITHQRDREIPPEVVSERVNATTEVIEYHYDRPNKLRRMESRRDYIENLE